MCTVLTTNVLIHVVKFGLSEPELRDKDMNVDDILAGVALSCQVAHGQFQYCSQWTNQSLHLANNTHIHSILYPLDDVEGVIHVALQDVKLDVVTA